MKTNYSLLIATFIALSGPALAQAADTSPAVDEMKAAVTPGEIVLRGSEMKVLHEGRQPEEYRVCVKAETDAAPMKLLYDKNELLIQPGGCEIVIGKKIRAKPADALTGKAHIVATFHHVREPK